MTFRKASPRKKTHPQNRQVFFGGGGFKKVVNPLGREGKHETHPARNGVFYDVALQGRFWGSLGMRNSMNHTSQFATDLFYLWNICLKHCEIALENNDSLGWKIDMEHKHGGLVQMMFLFTWVMFRFHVNFQWCTFSLLFFTKQT